MAKFLPQSLGLNMTFYYQEKDEPKEKDKPKRKRKLKVTPKQSILKRHISRPWEMGKCVPLEKLQI